MSSPYPDHDWFIEQVRREQAGLRAFVRTLGMRAEAVDDVAQEAFVVAFEKLQTFERGTNFGAWVRTIARFLVSKELRREERRQRVLAEHVAEMLIDDETVKNLAACHRLNTLTLGYREIAAAEIERLSTWKALHRLTLTHATLAEAALESLARLENVDTLDLIDCGLTDERLAHLKLSPKVGTLSLRQNEIAGPGLVNLAGLKLKVLGLEFNNIADDTLQDLPQLATLEQLYLEQCEKVTDAGIRTGILQGMTHLKELRLRGLKSVTDASLDAMVKFGHLKTISVRSAGISWEGVDRMKKAMPNTFVFK